MPHCVAVSTSVVPWCWSWFWFWCWFWCRCLTRLSSARDTLQANSSLARPCQFFPCRCSFWLGQLVGWGIRCGCGCGCESGCGRGRGWPGATRWEGEWRPPSGPVYYRLAPISSQTPAPPYLPHPRARTFAVLSPGKFRCRQRWGGWQIKNFWHGTEACWRHSHNDVGDCGDDSCPFSPSCPVLTGLPSYLPHSLLPCSGLSVIPSALPNILLIARVLSPDWRTFEVWAKWHAVYCREC